LERGIISFAHPSPADVGKTGKENYRTC
jgi:hypothetical protein